MPAGSLLNRRRVLSVSLQAVENALLPRVVVRRRIRCFGTKLEPRYIVGTGPLDQ
jgi:hypothetical protein